MGCLLCCLYPTGSGVRSWGLADSSEIVPQGIGDDVSSTAEIITNDQAQHLSTLGRLMQHPHMPIGSVGAVAVNDGNGEGGCFGFGHVVCFVAGILQPQAPHRPQVDQFGKRPLHLDHGQRGHRVVCHGVSYTLWGEDQ